MKLLNTLVLIIAFCLSFIAIGENAISLNCKAVSDDVESRPVISNHASREKSNVSALLPVQCIVVVEFEYNVHPIDIMSYKTLSDIEKAQMLNMLVQYAKANDVILAYVLSDNIAIKNISIATLQKPCLDVAQMSTQGMCQQQTIVKLMCETSSDSKCSLPIDVYVSYAKDDGMASTKCDIAALVQTEESNVVATQSATSKAIEQVNVYIAMQHEDTYTIMNANSNSIVSVNAAYAKDDITSTMMLSILSEITNTTLAHILKNKTIASSLSYDMSQCSFKKASCHMPICNNVPTHIAVQNVALAIDPSYQAFKGINEIQLVDVTDNVMTLAFTSTEHDSETVFIARISWKAAHTKVGRLKWQPMSKQPATAFAFMSSNYKTCTPLGELMLRYNKETDPDKKNQLLDVMIKQECDEAYIEELKVIRIPKGKKIIVK